MAPPITLELRPQTAQNIQDKAATKAFLFQPPPPTPTTGSWFDNNVAAFKSRFAANPALVSNGQFQMAQQMFDAVVKIVADELNALDPQPYGVLAALHAYKAEGHFDASLSRNLVDAIKAAKREANFPNTLKAFASDPTAQATAAAGFHSRWGNTGIPAPLTISNPTAQKVLASYATEKSACYVSTKSMAGKYIQARSSKAVVKGPPFAGVFANPTLKNEKSGMQTVVYSPGVLKDAVDKMGDAISRGYLYVVGVLSGIDHRGKNYPADPEHYLLLFAFNGTVRFLFWDSDSKRSDINSRSLGPGFGMLTYVDGRLSTAYDSSDFSNIILGGEFAGDHGFDPRRHRYQAYLAEPIS